MPPSSSTSVRALAQLTRYSKATVAAALSGSPTVAAETAKKIRAAAEAQGYKRNPMVGALMSAMRRSQGSTLKGVLAVAELLEPERPEHGPFHRELVAGCRACAEELGFNIEVFQVGPGKLTPERLSGILKARGIRGLVLLPAWHAPDFSRFDWDWFAGVYTDYITEHPTLNSVCCDHYRSLLELLHRLQELGYQRPGLFMEKERDERLHSRISAALAAFQAKQKPEARVPLLLPAEISRQAFTRWLTRHGPDVILSHHPVVLEWIHEEGLEVPGDLGFVSLNQTKTNRRCAALDLRPRLIGRAAVETLIAQVQRQVWGLPRFPTNTTVLGEFVEGQTLRRKVQTTG